MIAYYLLTGQKPLARSKPASTLVKGLSPKWDRLIDKCLELNIEDRYSSATCVLEDLEPPNPEYRSRPHRLRVFILLLAMATLGAMQLYLTYEEDFQRVFRSVRSPTGPVRTIAPGSGTENRMNSIDSATGPDPSSAYIVKLDALRAAAPLDPIEYEWINGTLSNALDDSEANAALSLLAGTISLDQWRQMPRLHHDARENIRGWRRSNLISTEEGDWLEAYFWGDRGESERQHANDLMKSSISVQQWRAATEFRFSILLPCDIEKEFIRVNGGRFTMGSPAGERGRLPWEKQRPVNIEAPIYNGVFEGTQHQFRAVMGRNPSFSRPLEGSEHLYVE